MLETKEAPIRVAQIMGKWNGGGVETVIMNYYKHIDRNKIQFDFICDEDSTRIPKEEIEKMGGKVIIVPPYQKLFKYIKELRKIFCDNKYKIVHSNISTLSVFPLYAAYKENIPVRIAHSHSTTSSKELKKNILKNFLKKFSRIFANAYFACSEKSGRYQFGDEFFEQGKVEIINNGIDFNEFKFDMNKREFLRNKMNIGKDCFVMGHIGRFVSVKNHKFLIEIYKKYHEINKNSKLILVGEGPCLKNIKRLVNENNLEKEVIFLGQRSDISEIYQLFDVFLLPSFYEGLPLVGVEAQIAELPCLFSSYITSEVKISKKTEFLNIDSINVWVKKLEEECLNRFNRKTIFLNNKNNFNIKINAEKLEEKYKLLIQNSKKIKVCHVISGLKAGGVESTIYNYCKRLDKQKYSFYMLYQHKASEKNIEEFNNINFQLKKICDKRKNLIKNYLDTYKFFKNEKIDVVHCHMNYMNIIPLLAAKNAKVKKRICHCHGNNIKKDNILIEVIKKFFSVLCKKNATTLLACGKESGLNMYGNDKFQVLNNAIDLEKFEFNKEKRKIIREKYGVNKDDFLIGHIGRLETEKNHLFMLEVFRKLKKENPKIKIIFVGNGSLEKEIKKNVFENKLENDVIFTGIVKNVQDYYSAIDLFVLPSIHEGLPLSALESQASGIITLLSENIDKTVIIDSKKAKMLPLNKESWISEIKKNIEKSNYTDRIQNVEAFNILNMNIDKEYLKLDKLYMEG